MYLERFRQVAREVEAHPLLELTRFESFDPVGEASISQARQRLQLDTDPEFLDFYKESNGLRLDWRLVQDVSDNEISAIAEKYDDYEIEWPDSTYLPFARINVLPLEQSLLREDWGEELAFVDDLEEDGEYELGGGLFSTADLRTRIKPFDVFGGDLTMSFFVEEGVSDLKVLYLARFDQEWYNTKITNLSSYLEMVLATRGIVEARTRHWFAEQGVTQPPVITGAEYYRAEIRLRDATVARFTPKLFHDER